jgi:hypothetical protein
MMAGIGLNGLFPEPPKPLTTAQLQTKAKRESVSNVCKGKKKSKTVKDLCKRWGETNA